MFLLLTRMLNDGSGGLWAAPFSFFEFPPTPFGMPVQINDLETAPLTGDLDGDGNDDVLFTRLVQAGPLTGTAPSLGAFFGDGAGASSSLWLGDPITGSPDRRFSQSPSARPIPTRQKSS